MLELIPRCSISVLGIYGISQAARAMARLGILDQTWNLGMIAMNWWPEVVDNKCRWQLAFLYSICLSAAVIDEQIDESVGGIFEKFGKELKELEENMDSDACPEAIYNYKKAFACYALRQGQWSESQVLEYIKHVDIWILEMDAPEFHREQMGSLFFGFMAVYLYMVGMDVVARFIEQVWSSRYARNLNIAKEAVIVRQTIDTIKQSGTISIRSLNVLQEMIDVTDAAEWEQLIEMYMLKSQLGVDKSEHILQEVISDFDTFDFFKWGRII